MEGVPGEGGGRVPAVNACVGDAEMQEQVEIPIAIDIHEGGLHHGRFRARLPKPDGLRINGLRVEIGIRENGHGEDARTARIDTIRKVLGLDIDEYLGDAESIPFCGGEGRVGVLATCEEEEQSKSCEAEQQCKEGSAARRPWLHLTPPSPRRWRMGSMLRGARDPVKLFSSIT